MKLFYSFILLAFALSFQTNSLYSKEAKDSLVNVTQFADYNTVTPGNEILIATQFIIKSEWHIYWRNPGDSGLPTYVEMNLPDGFEFVENLWPMPSVYIDGGLTSYGYKDEVILFTKLKVKDDVKPGEYSIPSKISWLVCKEVCLPGSVNNKLTITVGPKSAINSDWYKTMDFEDAIPEQDANVRVNATIKDNKIKLSLFLDDPTDDLTFYPYNEGVFAISKDQVVERTPYGANITMEVSELMYEVPEKVSGIIYFEEEQTAIEFECILKK